MDRDVKARIEAIKADPDFQELIRRRSRLTWTLTALMVTIYFGFILLIAFDKEALGASLFGGVTTVGIPIGLGVIVAAFILTGFYVAVANSTYDDLVKRIVERVKKA